MAYPRAAGGCEPRPYASGYWLEPVYPAEFQSLHPVLAFPPSLRVRSQRSEDEHGTVRCRWSERLNGFMQGDTLDMVPPDAHRFPAMNRAVRGPSSASVN